jgi:hypothetical protein
MPEYTRTIESVSLTQTPNGPMPVYSWVAVPLHRTWSRATGWISAAWQGRS